MVCTMWKYHLPTYRHSDRNQIVPRWLTIQRTLLHFDGEMDLLEAALRRDLGVGGISKGDVSDGEECDGEYRKSWVVCSGGPSQAEELLDRHITHFLRGHTAELRG